MTYQITRSANLLSLVSCFETALSAYQHLLANPKIWESAKQKAYGDPPDPFFCCDKIGKKQSGTRLLDTHN